MRQPISRLALLVAALLLASGCAGGWRNGPPAGEAEAPLTGGDAAAAPARTVADAIGVTFQYAGDAQSVNVAGEFNEWNTSADPMVKQADGSWKLVKQLAPGRYAYKFVIDGGTWKEDPNATESVDDGFGANNSIVVVGSSAGASGAELGEFSPVAPNRGVAAAPEKVDGGVRFTYVGRSRTVHLSGDFNAWSTTTDPMKREGGVWTIVKKLEPGTYQYKFLIDGSTWKTDAANSETTDDGFGGVNSVVTVD